ncbi:hypothetical protein Tco_1107798 [Tanacetum coccineum]
MRLKTDIKPKEATFQVVLDALALTPFYHAFLITADFFPKIPGQKFEDLSLEHDILSFIRDLGHNGDITYLTDKKQPAKKPKGKSLPVLSKVALIKAEQLKLATKRSKTQFHSSHVSGLGDVVDTQSKVPDEQEQKTSGADEGTGTILGVPDVPLYASESDKESWGDSDEEDDNEDDFEDFDDINDDDSDDNDESDDERMESDSDEIPDPNKSNEEHDEEEEEYDDESNVEEGENMDEKEDDESIN